MYYNLYSSIYTMLVGQTYHTGSQHEKSAKKPEPVSRKKPQRESLLDANRSQNVAIAKKKLSMSSDEIKEAISV